MNPIYDLLRSDGSIVVNKNLIFAIGLNESIIYAELVSRFNYFSDRGNLASDGYFYNTISDLQSGTGLGEKPQRAAIKNLEKLGLIDIDRRGMPPKRYFSILDNEPLLKDLLRKGKIRQAETLATSQLRLMGGIKDSQVAEIKTLYGRANNTKSNNTKHNPKTMGSLSGDKASDIKATLDFDSFALVYKYRIDSSVEESIERYTNIYRRRMKEFHPNLTEKQWEKVVDEWLDIDRSYDDGITVTADIVDEIVDIHFATKYTKGNYNIMHFIAGEIRKNRFHEWQRSGNYEEG